MGKAKSVLTILGATLASGATVITTNQVVEQYNYNNIHEITTNDVYYINGEEVSEDEFNDFKNNNSLDSNSVVGNTNNQSLYDYSGITYIDSFDTWYDYINPLKTEGTTYEYLAVKNCSNNTAGGCYDSYVLCVDSKDAIPELTSLVDTRQQNVYYNLSCFPRSMNVKYEDYVRDLTNRTSPGMFNNGSDWEDHDMGTYFLKNAKVEIVHKSKMCTYGGWPLTQIIISYDYAYSISELAQELLGGK